MIPTIVGGYLPRTHASERHGRAPRSPRVLQEEVHHAAARGHALNLKGAARIEVPPFCMHQEVHYQTIMH